MNQSSQSTGSIWQRLSTERGDPLFHVLRWSIIVAFTVMVVAAILQVIFRYFIGYPLGWTGELAQIMMIWFAFLSIPILARRVRLMRVDAVLVQLAPRKRAALNAAINLICAGFIGWMAFLSVRLLELAGNQISTALKIPYPYIYLSILLGLGFATLYFLAVAIAGFRVACSRDTTDSGVQRQVED